MVAAKNLVLVLDDSEESQDLMQLDLKKRGFNVHGVLNNEEALEHLEKYKYDCVVLDINLGNSSSAKALEHIRSAESSPNYKVPTVVASSYMKPDFYKRVSQKVNGVLAKPFKIGDLSKVVSEVIYRRSKKVLLACDLSPESDSIKEEIQYRGFDLEVIYEFDLEKKVLEEKKFDVILVHVKLLDEELDIKLSSYFKEENRNKNKETPVFLISDFTQGQDFKELGKNFIGAIDIEALDSQFFKRIEESIKVSSSIELLKADHILRPLDGREDRDKAALSEGKKACMRMALKSLFSMKLDSRTDKGQTALMLAIQLEDRPRIEVLVEEQGAGVNNRDKKGKSCLHFAAMTGNREIFEYLLDHGAITTLTDDFGNTALIDAIKFGHESIVRCWIDKGINIRFNNDGVDYLMYAASKGHMGIFDAFLEAGLSPRSVDLKGKSVLDYAKKRKNIEIIERIKDLGIT